MVDGDQAGQQVAQQQVRRRLGADVHVVTHRDGLRGQRQDVDRLARRALPVDRTGAAASRSITSRAIAPALSLPNHATSPGPCPSGANVVTSASASSTTHPGVVGVTTAAIGTTTPDSLAGASVTEPDSSKASAWPGSSAQPSATTADRIDRRSGSQTSGHVECRAGMQQHPAVELRDRLGGGAYAE